MTAYDVKIDGEMLIYERLPNIEFAQLTSEKQFCMLNTREQQIKAGLVKLGWMTPETTKKLKDALDDYQEHMLVLMSSSDEPYLLKRERELTKNNFIEKISNILMNEK